MSSFIQLAHGVTESEFKLSVKDRTMKCHEAVWDSYEDPESDRERKLITDWNPDSNPISECRVS